MSVDNCPTCGNEMYMYYNLWCPYCDKPVRKQITVLNLIQCLVYIEKVKSMPDYKRRVLNILNDYEFITGNDVYLQWPYAENEDFGFDNEELEDIKLINETFNIQPNEKVFMEISW